MDIELATHVAAHGFALRGLHAVEAEAFKCQLEVHSDGFSARVRFWPERWALHRFLSELREMDRTLSGEALLQPMWETEHVKLSLQHGGTVWVSGEVGHHFGNHLRFGFRTDQTVLAPLIRDLEHLLTAQEPAAQ